MNYVDRKTGWNWRDTLGAWSLVVFVVAGLVTAICAGIAGLNGSSWIYTKVFGGIAIVAFVSIVAALVLGFAHDEKLRREGIDNG